MLEGNLQIKDVVYNYLQSEMNQAIKSLIRLFPYLIQNIYFNFHYLPFRQAKYFPIWIYKPHFGKLKGKVVIDEKVKLKPGMIRLGYMEVFLYPSKGFSLENSGIIEFQGPCRIGGNSYVSIGETGHVIFGANFACFTSLKLTSYHLIAFRENVLVGWDCVFLDTDFHRLKSVDGERLSLPYGPIEIGHDTWVGSKVLVTKNTIVPSNCVIASGSLLCKKYDCKEYTLLGGSPAHVLKTGVYRDKEDDKIDYSVKCDN